MGPRGVRRERPVDGKGARYITPLHTVAWGGAEDSSGTNVFSQALTGGSGLCANPAFGMKLQFLTLVRDQKAQVAVVAPTWDGSVLYYYYYYGSVRLGGHGGPYGWSPPLTGDRVLSGTRGTMEVFIDCAWGVGTG
jgi:hypothetical protein